MEPDLPEELDKLDGGRAMHKSQALEEDPLAEFCRRVMAASQARLQKEQGGAIGFEESARPLQGLLAELDRAEAEDREYESLRPLLPDLEHLGRQSEELACIPGEIVRTYLHVASGEGHLEHAEELQQHMLHEERAWMGERRDARQRQRQARREQVALAAAAAAAASGSSLGAVPRNTRISPLTAAGSSRSSSNLGAGPWAAAGAPWCSDTPGPAGRCSSAASPAGPRHAGPSLPPGWGPMPGGGPPLLAVPRGHCGSSPKRHPGPCSTCGAQDRGQQLLPARRRPEEQEVPPEQGRQLEMARRRDEQARMVSYWEMWRRKKVAAPAASASCEPVEVD